jgi:hypothetical protein
MAKCSNVALRYRGPAASRPIASYENATLVRSLYRLEQYLKRRGWAKYPLRPLASYYTLGIAMILVFWLYVVLWLVW